MAAVNEIWYPKDYAAESERRRARMAHNPTTVPIPSVRYYPSNEAIREVAEAQRRERLKQNAPKTTVDPKTTAYPQPERRPLNPTTNLPSPKLGDPRVDEFLAQAAMKTTASMSSIRGQVGSTASSIDNRTRRIILEQGNISISVQDSRTPMVSSASASAAARRPSASSITKPRLEAVPEATEIDHKRPSASDNKSAPASAAFARPPVPIRQPGSSLPPNYTSASTHAPNLSRSPGSPAVSADRESISSTSNSNNSRHSDPNHPRTSTASKLTRPRTLSESAAKISQGVLLSGANPAPVSTIRRTVVPLAPAVQAAPAISTSPPSESRRHGPPAPQSGVPASSAPAFRNAFGEAPPRMMPARAALTPAAAFGTLGKEEASRLVRQHRFANIPEEDIAALRPPREGPRRASFESGTPATSQRAEFVAGTHRRVVSNPAVPPPGLPTTRRDPTVGPPTIGQQRPPFHAVSRALQRRPKKTLSMASLEVWTGETTDAETSGLESSRSSFYGSVIQSRDPFDNINHWIEKDDEQVKANHGKRTKPGVQFDFPEERLPAHTRLTESMVDRLPDAVRYHNER